MTAPPRYPVTLNCQQCHGDRHEPGCELSDPTYRITLEPGDAPRSAEQTVWTEDELALAFFDYSACAERRCDWSQPGPCVCRKDALRAVWLIKKVLPRSFPLTHTALTPPVPHPVENNGGRQS